MNDNKFAYVLASVSICLTTILVLLFGLEGSLHFISLKGAKYKPFLPTSVCAGNTGNYWNEYLGY